MNKYEHFLPEDRVVWSSHEDKQLLEIVSLYGTKKWKAIQFHMLTHMPAFNKSSKQCRERWHNYLNPSIEKSSWTEQELDTVFDGHRTHGTKWSLIGRKLIGRTDNAIKNVFYCRMRKLVRRIAKFTIDQDIYLTLKNFERALYILANLREQYIVPLEKTISIPGDQYIVRIAQKHAISSETLTKYCNHLLSMAPERMKCYGVEKYPSLFELEKDDTLTHSSLHSQECLLPKFIEEPTNKINTPPITNYEKSLFQFDLYMRKRLYNPVVIQ